MTEDPDLRSVFQELRVRPAPPHHLTPAAMVAAGQRLRRNRRLAAVAAGFATAVIMAVGYAIGDGPAAGPGPKPHLPADPPGITDTRQVPVPRPTPTPTDTPSTVDSVMPPVSPDLGTFPPNSPSDGSSGIPGTTPASGPTVSLSATVS